MPLNLFYTMVQKSQKWPKTQIKGGGPALNQWLLRRIAAQNCSKTEHTVCIMVQSTKPLPLKICP